MASKARSFRSTVRGRSDLAARRALEWSHRIGAGSIAVALGMTGVALLLWMSLLLSSNGERHLTLRPPPTEAAGSTSVARERPVPIAIDVKRSGPSPGTSGAGSTPALLAIDLAGGSVTPTGVLGSVHHNSLAWGSKLSVPSSGGRGGSEQGYDLHHPSQLGYHNGTGKEAGKGETKAGKDPHKEMSKSAKEETKAEKEQRTAEKEQRTAEKEQRKAEKEQRKTEKEQRTAEKEQRKAEKRAARDS